MNRIPWSNGKRRCNVMVPGLCSCCKIVMHVELIEWKCRFIYIVGQLVRYGTDILQANSADSDSVDLQQLRSTLVSFYILKPGIAACCIQRHSNQHCQPTHTGPCSIYSHKERLCWHAFSLTSCKCSAGMCAVKSCCLSCRSCTIMPKLSHRKPLVGCAHTAE